MWYELDVVVSLTCAEMVMFNPSLHLRNIFLENIEQMRSQFILKLQVIFTAIPHRLISPLFKPLVEP
jgi:hypothetical protein